MRHSIAVHQPRAGDCSMKERCGFTPVAVSMKSRGVLALVAVALVGAGVALYRFAYGLSHVTNLDQQHPWGLWIALDVATGVALAAGGFTTAALAYIFHRDEYQVITRPALLTALLGYTFVGLGLLVDLGRYYNIWHPAWPSMWQGNSVLFEVGMCVMGYLTVLYIEFLPIACERFMGDPGRPRLRRVCTTLHPLVHRTQFLFIIAGVVLSCLHQSSLGNLMIIAPTKMHPLWYSPVLGLLFLLSAVAVGYPMVIVESIYASWAFRRPIELSVLARLARIETVLLAVYLAAKLIDMVVRESQVYLADASLQSFLFVCEVLLGVLVPLFAFTARSVRERPMWLLGAALLVVGGVALNRVNVFLVAYQPPFAVRPYVPALGEWAVTAGFAAALILAYRMVVTWFPVLTDAPKGGPS